MAGLAWLLGVAIAEVALLVLALDRIITAKVALLVLALAVPAVGTHDVVGVRTSATCRILPAVLIVHTSAIVIGAVGEVFGWMRYFTGRTDQRYFGLLVFHKFVQVLNKLFV